MNSGNPANFAISASIALAECTTIAREAASATSEVSTALATYANSAENFTPDELHRSYMDVLHANSVASSKLSQLLLKHESALYAARTYDVPSTSSASVSAIAGSRNTVPFDPEVVGSCLSTAIDTTANRPFPNLAAGSSVSPASRNNHKVLSTGYQYTNQPVVNDNSQLAPANSRETNNSPNVASDATITSSASASTKNIQPCSSSNHHSQNLSEGSDVLTPSSNSGQAVTGKVNYLCVVCKRDALPGLQYGAKACKNCRDFFFNNLQKNTREIPNCENDLKCDVTHRGETSRFKIFGYNCRYCRFKKCQEHMDSSKVGKWKRRKF